MNEVIKDTNVKIDELEAAMLQSLQLADCPLIHIFFPKIYTRQILMKQGMLITSKIHKTEHPFFILKGKLSVYSDNNGAQILEAPYFGRTLPRTRRVLFIHEDCVWITIHPLDFITGEENEWNEERKEELVNKIEKILIEPHTNTVTGENINKQFKELLNKKIDKL